MGQQHEKTTSPHPTSHSNSHNPNSGHGSELRAVTDLFSRFKGLVVDPAEFACLKAIILFKPDAKGLKEPAQVENLQDQAQVRITARCLPLIPDQNTHSPKFQRKNLF